MRSEQTTICRMIIGAAVLAVLPSSPALAEPRIGDITHLQGSRTNKLSGLGLVVGLPGTGDGGKYAPTIRGLAALHKRYANPVISLQELKNAKNVAIVQVDATLPKDGAREGDRVDVVVSSLGPAKSLKGGRLLLTPLVGPNPDDPRGVMALASGPLQLEDSEIETVARISGGATLEQDWIHNYIVLGRELPVAIQSHEGMLLDEPYVTLVIDEPHAQWAVAYHIANTVNSEFDIGDDGKSVQIATAIDPRTVVVRIPPMDRNNPASFLYNIEKSPLLMPRTEARVTIHRPSETIVISGEVEIAPAVVSHKGLTITTVNTQSPASQEGSHRARLQDLVDAMNQLRMPAADRITIIRKLHETGRLHATLIVED